MSHNTEEANPVSGSRRPSYSQGVFFASAGTAVSIVLLFLETIVAARLLDTDNLGIYVLLVVAVELLVMIVDFGCTTSVTQLIASSELVRQGAITNSILIFRVVLLGVVASIIYFARNVLLLLDLSSAVLNYTAYVPAMLVVASFDELLLAILQGFQAYQHMSISQVIRSILRAILSFVFLFKLQWGVDGLIYSWMISFALSSVYQYLALPIPKRFYFRQSLIKEILRFGLPVQGMRILWFVLGRINLMLVGAFTGPSGVAYLNVASRIPTAFSRLSQSYMTVYFPAVTELLAKDKRDQACWMLDQSLRLLSFILAFGALIAVLFGQYFTILLFSDKYILSSPAFGLLMIELHMSVLLTLMGYTLTAAGYPGRSLSQNVVRTVLTVVANLLLIPPLGFIGSAYAGLIADYVTNPICVQLLRCIGIRMTISPLAKQIALLWLCVVLFWWLQPSAFIYKVAFILFFLVLNLVASTISMSDLAIILPEAVAKRMHIQKVQYQIVAEGAHIPGVNYER